MEEGGEVGDAAASRFSLCVPSLHLPTVSAGLKMCVSSGNSSDGTSVASQSDKHLHVPAIIVTPPTPTGTMLSREARRVGGAPPCSQC